MIERGLSRLERQLLVDFRNNATAIPKTAASATKYQSVGNPSTKIKALPAAKSNPMKPPPTESLCMVMPECHFSAMEHLALIQSSYHKVENARTPEVMPCYISANPQNPNKGSCDEEEHYCCGHPCARVGVDCQRRTENAFQRFPAKIEHGKYLVENIGMCGDCHTPHNKKGEPIKEQWLKGTELPFKSTVPMPWADKSVNIVGLPGWEHDAAVKFFVTGIAYNGLPARPPMPQYRYSREDAEAIVAYLKSLGTSK